MIVYSWFLQLTGKLHTYCNAIKNSLDIAIAY